MMEDKRPSPSVTAEPSINNDQRAATSTADIGGTVSKKDGTQCDSEIIQEPLLCPVSWLEFTEWLERGLDDCGLEPTLYARCVLSILKQPPEPASDLADDQDESWPLDNTSSFLSTVRYGKAGKNLSAPSSRKNSFGSLTMTLPTMSNIKGDRDARKQALLDCLKTTQSDEAALSKFVDGIMNRYASACKFVVTGETQNDSVDSGVCPSPEESFQNYDEAFPPLAGEHPMSGNISDVFIGDDNAASQHSGAPVSWINGKRRAQDNPKSALVRELDLRNCTEDDHMQSSRNQDDASPVKRPKLLLELAAGIAGNRSLHSCPDFDHFSEFTVDGHSTAEKRATFCCPVVKKQSVTASSSIGCKVPPQFVIPKCWKVGSWPSRYDRSIKPAGDVPFWSCSEWFCTVHKRLEFGLLNAKINGDTKSLAPPSAASITLQTIPSPGDDVPFSSTIENTIDAEIFEIEPSLPQSMASQHRQQPLNYAGNICQNQPDYEQHPQTVPEMFDAPRFILRIINEDERNNLENPYLQQNQNYGNHVVASAEKSSSNWTPFFETGTLDDLEKLSGSQYDQANGTSWNHPAVQSKLAFNTLDVYGNADIISTSDTIVPVDVSRSFYSDVGFCMPKCGPYPALAQQHQKPAPVDPGAITKNVDDSNMNYATTGEKSTWKQHPLCAAVRVTESTHFIPIRSESMEDAYFLKPGFDDDCAVIDSKEQYYVFHQDTVVSSEAAASTTVTSTGSQQISAPFRTLENVCPGEQRKQSLAVKFLASNPDKMCQTEVEEMEFELRAADIGEHGTSLSFDYQIPIMENQWCSQRHLWAYHQRDFERNMNSDGWPGEITDTRDGLAVGNTFSHIDDTWNDRSLGKGSPSLIKQQNETVLNCIAGNGVQPQCEQQRLEIWQEEDERYEDSLLRYVSNISLISPLDIQTTTV